MGSEYFHRAPRTISIGGISYSVEAKIKKGEDAEKRNNGFDFFIKEIKRGAKFEKAKKRVWNEFRVRIYYEIEKVKNEETKSVPKKEKLKVTVE